MKVAAYIRSLKDKEQGRNVLGEAEILECTGSNEYLAEYNGTRCKAIFNFSMEGTMLTMYTASAGKAKTRTSGTEIVMRAAVVMEEERQMRKWDVTIAETLARRVSVEAESLEEAEEIVGAQYERCEIILNAEDCVLTEITAEHEGACPLCGAGIVYSGQNIIDDAGGLFPWECPACGARGDESYLRKFSRHLHVEEGKNPDKPGTPGRYERRR